MKICITGKKNSGKTTFINYLKSLGLKTFIADEYINEIYKKNNIGFNFILKEFGSNYIKDELVNKAKLNELIINDINSLNILNKFSIEVLSKWIIDLPDDSFIELGIYLNHYKEFHKLFNKVILIKNDSIIDDKNHVSSFLKVNKKNKFDKIIINNGTLKEFHNEINKFLVEY